MRYYIIHHKIFNLEQFRLKSKNFSDPPHFIFRTLLEAGDYSVFSIYEVHDSMDCCLPGDLKTFLDNKYGATAVHVIYKINEAMSAGYMNFQIMDDLKDKY